MKKKKKKKQYQQNNTSFARSTFGFPFSNKSWTICSYPLKAAIKRGVAPFFTLKIEKWVKKEKETISTK